MPSVFGLPPDAFCLHLAAESSAPIASNGLLRTPVSRRNASPFSSLTESNLIAAPLWRQRIKPWLIEGYARGLVGESFTIYVEKVLAPTLKVGDLVMMDNLGSHKRKAIRRAIRSAGARLFFLPKYSPDLNPIEQVFAKLKHMLRKAGARTIEGLYEAIRQLLSAFPPEECTNYFKNAGYALT